MSTLLILRSNFRDFYDHAFDSGGQVFNRIDTGGLNRRQMFSFLESLGLKTPPHGIVKELVPKLLSVYQQDFRDAAAKQILDVVVYTDEKAHRGEGKEKVAAAEALERFPDHYCSEFIYTTQTESGRSFRHLQVGTHNWWIESWSDSDWRSNVGEGGEYIRAEAEYGYQPKIKEPIFAVDFVKADRLYAIDYNVAPSLASLKRTVTPTKIVESIKHAVEHFAARPKK